MARASGQRIGWADLPGHVRAAVEAVLGAPVVAAVSQPGGFSPGTADRVRTADGRRAFVKAVSSGLNPHTPDMHRREVHVTGALPLALPVPRLLGSYDDGTWVALVLEDVEGRHPHTPWHADEVGHVLAALEALAAEPLPASLADLPRAGTALAEDLGNWDAVAADPPADLDPWAAAHLAELRELGVRAAAAVAGDALVHCDVRADNLLVRPDGGVVVVDWPWACRGAAWLDTLMLLVNVNLHGGHDVEALLPRGATVRAEPAEVTAVLAGLAGYFVHTSRLPAPPGLPTVREFQRAQGEALLPWVRERVGRWGTALTAPAGPAAPASRG
ncbi:hypothetical protein NUM3379_35770 [Kineococcus sp. NUM-3379]